MNNDPFWFVWNEGGGAPRVKHMLRDTAIAEAQRLARVNPGETFVVLQTVCAFAVNDMHSVDLRPRSDDSSFDEIPF